VADLDDGERAAKLDAAIAAAGWRELRAASDDGGPWASAVEVAVVAEELGRGPADAAFVGPTLAADLRRLAGAPPPAEPETVALTADLATLAVADAQAGPAGAVGVDARHVATALVLVPGDGGFGLGQVELSAADVGTDLTRPAASPTGEVTPVSGRDLQPDDLAAWQSLGLAVACADLVGVMRGAVTLAADYARSRRQYGATIGSFQAVQHLLADALVAMEGSRSIALHAAWAVDALPAPAALAATSAAKAYCTRAARAVCETAIQVHGGIGNTWECMAHVYLRRALLSGDFLGGVGASLDRVLAAQGIGGGGGLR
jgi:alkylation response protein AidB-like acyl-CoA dehydrogenase